MAMPAFEYVIQFPLSSGRQQKAAPETQPLVVLRDDLARLRASLAETAAGHMTSASELVRQQHRTERTDHFVTNVPSLDRLLGGGLPKGKMVELSGRRSSGRFGIVLSTLAAATSAGEAAALIDAGDHLDPEAAANAGIDLPRLLWVRPQSIKDAVTAAEMLITTGFPLVVIDLGLQLRGRRVHDAAWIRLGRTAEAHGASILISTPWPIARMASEAAVTIPTARAEWQGRGRSPRLLTAITSKLAIEKHRHQKPGAFDESEFRSSDAIRSGKRRRDARDS